MQYNDFSWWLDNHLSMSLSAVLIQLILIYLKYIYLYTNFLCVVVSVCLTMEPDYQSSEYEYTLG